MDPKIRKQLIKILESGKDIPASFKEVLFPEEEKNGRTEGKGRKSDDGYQAGGSRLQSKGVG